MNVAVSGAVARAGVSDGSRPQGAQHTQYEVRRGDTLSAIASRMGVPLKALVSANPGILNPDVIYPGQMVSVPSASARGEDGGTPSSAVPASAAPEMSVAAAQARQSAGGVTAAQLQRIVPGLSAAKAAEVAPNLNNAMAEAKINTPTRQAMFIAQLAHESGGFRYSEEIWGPTAAQRGYEGRADLGNTHPGDGYRFRGRGYIQLTGRYNYDKAGRALGLDLVGNPDLASRPQNAARVAAWYWNSRNINAAADAGDFVKVTRLINGGTNGLAARQAYYDRARSVLGSGGGPAPGPDPGPGPGPGPGPSPSRYTVRSGDTLSGIASRFGTTVGRLQQANPSIRNPDLIYAGQTLAIPGAGGGNRGGDRPSGYTVRSGDTLSGIASRFGTTVGRLQQANPSIRDPDLIYAGQRLAIPGGGDAGGGSGTYTVRSGDTLSGIASRFGTTVGRLQQDNAIRNPDLIHPGQTLKVPGGGSSPTPAPAPATRDYTVRSGDTLGGIATRFDTTVGKLMGLNPQIADPDRIYAGQTIRVSGTAPSGGPDGPTPTGSGQAAADLAARFLGRNASELKRSGALPMNPNVPSNVCCANFVSAVLQKAGLLDRHTDLVTGSRRDSMGDPNAIGAILKSRGWKVVPASQARPGDVAIVNNGHHVELVHSNKGGKITLIGSNNVNSDGSQRISWGSPYGNAWYLSPP